MPLGRRSYPSDLSGHEWKLIKKLLPPARSGGRPRTTNVQEVMNAILYLNRSGCAWRYLPDGFPPWQTVYDYFSKWVRLEVWRKINLLLTRKVRRALGRTSYPSFAIIDSQSVRAHYGENRGYDGFKKVRGRKRHIIVDTQGFLWAVDVQSATLRDPRGGLKALHKLPRRALCTIKTILGDAAYVGPFDDHAHVFYGIKVERTKTYKESGDTLKPKRWIVERDFAWLNHFRRHSRDYEKKTSHSEAMIHLTFIRILLRRLQKLKGGLLLLYFPNTLRRSCHALTGWNPIGFSSGPFMMKEGRKI